MSVVFPSEVSHSPPELKKLHLKPGILIGCIIRSNKVIFPHGDNTIELHDSVIVITTNQALLDLRDILAD